MKLYKDYGVDKSQFLLVGHSLGGQICGFVGKQFKKKTLETLPRIIALDPAGRPSSEVIVTCNDSYNLRSVIFY